MFKLDKLFFTSKKQDNANDGRRKTEERKQEELKAKEAELKKKLADIDNEYEKAKNLKLEFEQRKREADPLFKFWEDKPEAVGLTPEEMGIDYRAIKEIPDQNDPEKKTYHRQIFTNYHDFLTFQNSLTSEQRARLVDSHWTSNQGSPREEKWTSPSTYSNNSFNDRLKENGDLYKYAAEYRAVAEQARTEKLADNFTESEESVDREYSERTEKLSEEEKRLRTELHWLGRENERQKFEEEEKSFEEKRREQEAFEQVGPVSREHLENIRIKKGKIEKPLFKDFEYTRNNLDKELTALVHNLLTDEGPEVRNGKGLENNFIKIAKRTRLSLESIQEIYNQHKDSLVAEAKAEINADTGVKTKIAKTLLKSGIYVGAGILAGTTTAATLGIGGLVGASAIAGARVLDRLITEKIGQKKLNAKVEEIKKRKSEDDKKALQNRLAAAISLRKKLEIEGVNLSAVAVGSTADKAGREKIIGEYIEEQAKAGLLKEIAPDQRETYKNKMARVLIGLDDIDRFNAEKEAEINKPAWFDKLKKFEGKLTGDTAEQKTVSSAVIIAAGLAAREIPGIRQILSGYVGWKLGGTLGDRSADKMEKRSNKQREEYLSQGVFDEKDTWKTYRNYSYAIKKLADDNFRKSDPEGYLKLKQEVEKAKINMVNSMTDAAKNLNDSLEYSLGDQKANKRVDDVIKILFRASGAALGFLTGEAIKSIGELKSLRASETEASLLRPSDSAALVSDSEAIKPDSPEIGSGPTFKEISVPAADTVVTVGPAPDNLPIAEADSEQISDDGQFEKNVFEDKISNVGLKPGQHDSVWRSTEQIFKNNAEKLGYEGDLNDADALKHWAEVQTAGALNNSEKITDQVFEGNRVILEKNSEGNYQVRVEAAEGNKPGFLERNINQLETKKIDQITGSGSEPPEEIFGSTERSEHYPDENKIVDKTASAERPLKASAETSPDRLDTIVLADEEGKIDAPLIGDDKIVSSIADINPDSGSDGASDIASETSPEIKSDLSPEVSSEIDSAADGEDVSAGQVETGGGNVFNLNDGKSLEKLLNTNSEVLFQKFKEGDLKNLELKFDSKYSAAEQIKIKNFIAHEILESREKQSLLEQYQAQYGDRPQFGKFKKLMTGEIADDKDRLIGWIKGCDNPNGHMTARGEYSWRNGEYRQSAQADIDVMASRARLISLEEESKKAMQKLNNM